MENDLEIVNRRYVLFCQNLLNYLPSWLCHFAFPSPMRGCSYYLTSSPAFGGVSIQILVILIDVQWHFTVVVLTCISLMIYNTEYLVIIFSISYYLLSVYLLW